MIFTIFTIHFVVNVLKYLHLKEICKNYLYLTIYLKHCLNFKAFIFILNFILFLFSILCYLK